MKTRLSIAILLAAICIGPAAGAETFDRASTDVDARLESALAELARVREKITSERIPLSRSVNALEQEVVALRKEHARLLKVRDSRSIDLTSLRAQVASQKEQEEFIQNRLREFVHDFEARLDISEMPRFEKLTEAATLGEKDVNLDAGQRRARQVAVVQAALGRLDDQLGGQVFPGEALGPDGVLSSGRFVALGPTVFYASEDGEVAGLVENQLNAADPVVVPLPGDFGEHIAVVAASSSGGLPLDPTLGKALKVEKASKSLLDRLNDGGAVGYIIAGLGIVALAVGGFKVREITAFPVVGPDEVDSVLNEIAKGNDDAARWEAEQVPGVAGQMLATGVEHAADKRGVLEELLFERILTVRPTLERFLPFLAIIAAAAPLLGLLGTVTGMIKTFQLITIFGTGDAKSLSSGISEALVTTALGLIVAIPTLIVHGALARMAKHRIGMLEQLSVAFVNGVATIRHSDER
jgi:biopolymer transport protein ExbB